MAQKSQTLELFCTFKALVENFLNKTNKSVRSDNGGEYTSNLFHDYLRLHGIQHQFTVAYNPQQNGIAERKMRALVEMVQSMLHGSSVPKELWGEALMTANFLLNRTPTKALLLMTANFLLNRTPTKALLDKTPYEMVTGTKPNVSNYRVFGCGIFLKKNEIS